MKLKVCGMKYEDNIQDIADIKPDYMGFIFYPKSRRYAEGLNKQLLLKIPEDIVKVGVFVNSTPDEIDTVAKAFGFKMIQLHGHESLNDVTVLKRKGYIVIKVFPVSDSLSAETYNPFKGVADYFLFDTKTPEYGGSGNRFNWNILKDYDNEVPIFLSGGIGLEMAEEIKSLKNLNVHAIDINSCFETAPGLKDPLKVKAFKEKLRFLKNID